MFLKHVKKSTSDLQSTTDSLRKTGSYKLEQEMQYEDIGGDEPEKGAPGEDSAI